MSEFRERDIPPSEVPAERYASQSWDGIAFLIALTFVLAYVFSVGHIPDDRNVPAGPCDYQADGC